MCLYTHIQKRLSKHAQSFKALMKWWNMMKIDQHYTTNKSKQWPTELEWSGASQYITVSSHISLDSH